MFWADKLLKDRKGKEWINDAWTPSGMIHMGGIKGPVIHDVLFKATKNQGKTAKYTFGMDDFDPIDGLPPGLQQSHLEYMGIPIFMVPSPDGKGSFGDYFATKMLKLFKELGIKAEIYYASDYYKKGIYNEAIRFVLDNADKIRKVYEETYKKKISQNWYPFQVICPNCKKLGTTKVSDWDEKEVSFSCEENLVKWAKGCGATGKMSPFNGNGKMPFKVEWAAKWVTFGVTMEAAGKDHASAGGTYDVAIKITREVFKKKPPLKLPYEHFLSGGKKMASSKGVGLSAQGLLEVIPPEIARFLMIKTKPNQAVEFSPFGTDLIPNLYDEYQKAADRYSEKSEDEIARAFELSQIGDAKKTSKVRFSTLTQWVQMPNMGRKIKEEDVENWAKYAKVWVEKYAPEEEKFLVQEELPKEVNQLSEKQKDYLARISDSKFDFTDPEKIQVDLYNLAKESGISSKEAFSAIYTSLIGKAHGPKAAWLISSLGKEFIQKRFKAASS